MKFLVSLFVVALLITGLYGYQDVSYAQDTSPVETPVVDQPPAPPDELPDTAAGALPFIEKWLLFASALLATHIMNGVKGVPWFGKQSWFVKLTTELVSGVTASVLAFLLGTAAVGLGFLDQSGLWQVIAFAWPAAVGIYHTKKFSGKVAA